MSPDEGNLIRPETDTEVANKLGVSRELVNQVIKNTNGSIIYHDRVKAREYYDGHSDASYREVAEKLGVSRELVSKVVNCSNDTRGWKGFHPRPGWSKVVNCSNDTRV